MKISDIITQKLVEVGIERPSPRLVEEAEKLVHEKITNVIGATLKPKVVAKAFLATLIRANNEKGGMGGSA